MSPGAAPTAPNRMASRVRRSARVAVGQGLAGLEPVLGTELVVGLLEHDPLGGRGLLEDLQGLGGDLRADAVAGDDCQINRGCAHIFRVAKCIHILVKSSHYSNTGPPADALRTFAEVHERSRTASQD